MDGERPRAGSRATGRILRWGLVGFAVSWAVLALVDGVFCGTFHWGAIEPLRPSICRVSNLSVLPFATLAGSVTPSSWDHAGLIHELIRTGFAAGVFTLTVIALILARRRDRRAERSEGGSAGQLDRRRALSVITDAGVVGAGLTLGGWTVLIEPGWLRVARYEVALSGLPASLDGLRLVHITDTHYGPYVGEGLLREAVALANRLRPDLVVLTGDYVHRSERTIEPGIAPFAGFRARWGTVAVLGNHDHWEGAEAIERELRRRGVTLLDEAWLFLTADGPAERERAGASVAICGVGDLWEGRCDPNAALEGVSEECPRVLLSHNPDVAEYFPRQRPAARFDLQLSGHTHGGQVRLPLLGTPVVPSDFGDRYAGGMVRGPRWPVIISRAVGMSVAPVRLRVRPEVGLVVLRRA